MYSIFLCVLCSFNIFDHPDSVDIKIENQLQNKSIEEISYIIPGSSYLHTADLLHPVSPDSQLTIRVPYGYINMMIFETDDESVYSVSGYPASANPGTIRISLADKQFGGLFDRIYGIYPVVIENSTDINLFDIRILGDSILNANILRNNVLLPGELLRLWIDSGEIIQIFAVDCKGNTSSLITAVTPVTDSLYKFTPSLFYDNGNEFGYDGTSEGSWVIDCITFDEIVKVEAFTIDGSFIDGIDCSSSPLATWDRVFIRHRMPIGYIICTDSNNRTYSADTPDSISNDFIFGDLNLDFGFGFPE